jgi:hypothetical protein
VGAPPRLAAETPLTAGQALAMQATYYAAVSTPRSHAPLWVPRGRPRYVLNLVHPCFPVPRGRPRGPGGWRAQVRWRVVHAGPAFFFDRLGPSPSRGR